MRTHAKAIGGLLLLAGALWGAPAVVRPQSVLGSRPPRHAQSTVPPLKEGPLTAADEADIARRWGIRIECVRLVSSGYMVEFRYRILDAARAQPLFDLKQRPLLKDDASGFETHVPSPPTTGALRNTYDAKAGRTYFMFFANPAQFLKPGSRVTVTIGAFGVSDVPVTDDSGPKSARGADGSEQR